MKYGPIRAVTSAMIKAIASPSSVVCTVSPLQHAPALEPCPNLALPTRQTVHDITPAAPGDHPSARRAEINAGTLLHIETSVAKSQHRRVTNGRRHQLAGSAFR